jgi:hypothetical protein
MNQIVNLTSLPIMAFHGQPVATTEMLAQLYGCETDNIRQNLRRNAARFEEGKHLITLQGDALKEFVSCVTNSYSPFAPSKQARVVNLWTERGAARHAKLLSTDQAWEVFEELEDCYFHAKAQAAAPQALPSPVLTPSGLDAILDKPMQITVREYLSLTQGKAVPQVFPPAAPQTEHPYLGHYSDEIRAQVLDLGNKGWLPSDIVDRTGVGLQTVKTMLFRARKAGKIAKGPHHGTRARDAKGGAA